jgi:hypothetical protein
MFAWRRLTSPVSPTPVEFTDYGVALDALFNLARTGAVTSYVGVGGSYVLNRAAGTTVVGNGHTVGALGLCGVRARIVERIHLFGEASLNYLDSRGLSGQATDQLVLRTTPLGVLIYLK